MAEQIIKGFSKERLEKIDEASRIIHEMDRQYAIEEELRKREEKGLKLGRKEGQIGVIERLLQSMSLTECANLLDMDPADIERLLKQKN